MSRITPYVPPIFFLSVFFIAFAPGTSIAATEYDLSPVIVTATRTAQTADETLSSVTVITREDIERTQPHDVYEVLRTTAGIDLARNGGTADKTSLFMRGSNSDHVLVLIDGLRVSSATDGTFAFRTLDVSLIERIEIVRGPRASLYGSDAIGGVIQIFTRSSRGAHVTVTGGSFATREITAGYGGGKSLKYNINVNARDIGGYSSANANNLFSFDPDKDALKAKSINLSLNVPFTRDLSLDFSGWYSNNESEYDVGELDSDERVSSLKLNYKHNKNWNQILSLGHSSDDVLDAGISDINSKRASLDWQNDLVLDESQLLTAGLNYYEDKANNLDLFSNSKIYDESIDNKALFVNWQGQFGKHNFQAGGRYDRHSDFGSKATGHLAWGMAINKVQVRTSYGTAFKAPNFDELFHPGFGGLFAGNPDLQPETSDTLEIGALHNFGKNHTMDVSLYSTRFDNLIAFTGGATFQATNVGQAEARGLEITYQLNKGAWQIRHNITLQKTVNKDTNTALLRRADRKMSFSVSRRTEKGGNAGAEFLFSSESEDFIGFQTGVLPGYGVLNLFASYPMSKQLTIKWRIENLLDKEYETVSGYNTKPASAFITLHYQI